MAYKIQYSPEDARRYPQVRKKSPIKKGRWFGLILVITAALWIRVNGVPDFLIPGDPEVTRAATAMMIDKMQAGASFGDAVTAFCEKIIDGAGL